jgi:hypothetical protein
MIETSFETFSAGRVDMNAYAASRGRFGGLVFEDEGFASAKQTFLPFGVAVYAPHVPNCPTNDGSAPPIDGTATGFAGAAVDFAA